MARAIEQLKQAMEACELGALTLPDQVDALMDAGKAILQEVSTLTPPNEPLTLDELREMNGEPVWVNSIRLWGIVRVYSYGIRVLTKSGEFDITRMKIYRRPPEGEEDA